MYNLDKVPPAKVSYAGLRLRANINGIDCTVYMYRYLTYLE